MGQAKRRGIYEQRMEQAQLAQQIIEKAFPNEPASKRQLLINAYGGVRQLAAAIVTKQKGKDFYRGWPIVTKLMSPPLYAAEHGNEFSPCFKTREELYKWIDEREGK